MNVPYVNNAAFVTLYKLMKRMLTRFMKDDMLTFGLKI